MDFRSLLGEPIGQSSLQLAELAFAFILSATDRPRARNSPEERRPAHVYACGLLVGFRDARVQIWLHRCPRIWPGGARSVAYRGADRFGHRLHQRRPHFRSQGYRAGPHHGGDGLADRGSGHGLRRRPSDLGHRGHVWPFRRGLRLSLDRAPAAKIPLGSVVAANFLPGRARRPSRGVRMLHPRRVRGQSSGG